ncbi:MULTISPECIES: glutamine synthetase III [unclassified Treponema]|uniref:glutamine synthetase III family protein n=1 Tax=unclassified Treponema TaxID=2638727 RepID=UPI0025F95DD4|nr:MULTISPECIES: glutamine synthetase III [unclassified Treponema]
MSTNVPELFGSMVFNQKVMKERLPKETFKALKKTLDDGEPLKIDVANQVAHAMKEWAIEKGATHFTHWFQPLTGITAEKHDSFITPQDDGTVIMSFSGKELVKGEPDASSFPSGGRRATFEARGYTVWDPTAYPFVKEHTLCIPTAFCSYTGEALDKKTPLLRSMEALNKQALRILKLFGNEDATHVATTVGPEQEYFIVDQKLYSQRKDLRMTGRTLFGAKPSKGQEMDDQYFAALNPRIVEYMEDLNDTLWKYGILSKTEHNEVAPAQHEMAPIFTTTNLAADQNQLTMEVMKKVARRHGLVCLLHEKPFAGLNGSGKHNNWSMSTNLGENLLEPGKTPEKNAQFLLFLTAVIKAVDENQDLLRISVASAGNDHRLGANEAPPAIISMYLGDELYAVLESIKDGKPLGEHGAQKMTIGVDVLPPIPKDSTDRNRTSPFAFTGNKFEFRSCGSSLSISGPNTTLDSIVAYTLKEFADELEKATDFDTALAELIKREVTKHWRVIFNGNGYDSSWVDEAEKRGLLNLRTLPDAMAHYLDSKNVKLFTEMGVYTDVEMNSHYEIKLEKYAQILNIEVQTMLEMISKDILPAAFKYMDAVSKTAIDLKSVVPGAKASAQAELLSKLDTLVNSLAEKAAKLDKLHEAAQNAGDCMKIARAYVDTVIPAMTEARAVADEIEPLLGEDYKPFPSYEDLLFRV